MLYLWCAPSLHSEDALKKYGYPKGSTLLRSKTGLKLPYVFNLLQINSLEYANVQKAEHKHFYTPRFPLDWFNEEGLARIHRDMFGDVWEWSGIYYEGPMRNLGLPWEQIKPRIRDLSLEVRRWLKEGSSFTFLEQSARIFHTLIQIHPFTNGNGRFARFVADLYLFSLHGQKAAWPYALLLSDGRERSILIEALQFADAGNFYPLENLMRYYGASNPFFMAVVEDHYFKQHFSLLNRIDLVEGILYFNNRTQLGALPRETSPSRALAEAAILLMRREDVFFVSVN